MFELGPLHDALVHIEGSWPALLQTIALLGIENGLQFLSQALKQHEGVPCTHVWMLGLLARRYRLLLRPRTRSIPFVEFRQLLLESLLNDVVGMLRAVSLESVKGNRNWFKNLMIRGKYRINSNNDHENQTSSTEISPSHTFTSFTQSCQFHLDTI